MASINLGVADSYYFGPVKEVGKDLQTGEVIKRKKTFVLTDFAGSTNLKIDEAIIMARTEIRKSSTANPPEPWITAPAMVTLADLLANRDNAGDRAEAKKTLCKLIIINTKDPMEKIKLQKQFGLQAGEISAELLTAFSKASNPQVPAAQGYIGLAELALKQLSDNQTPVVSLATAIEYCKNARQKLSAMKGNEKDYYFMAKSAIVQAKLMALNGNPKEEIESILKEAKVNWSSIEGDIKNNPYITGQFKPKYLSVDQSIAKTKEGMSYLSAWADVESVKLTAQVVKVAKSEESAFQTEITNAIAKVVNAQKAFSSLKKEADYANHDAVLTQADLTAKLARLTDSDSLKKEARDLYEALASQTKFNDIRSLARAGQISMDIELAVFNWDDVDKILADNFDPSAGVNNLKYPFDSRSYSYMALEMLESQLRNEAKRDKISFEKGADKIIPDYKLANIRSKHVIDSIDGVIAIRDKRAITDLKARAMLQNARAIAISAMAEKESAGKIAKFDQAIATLNGIFTMLKEPEASITPQSDLKLEGSFYVAVKGEIASMMEQKAWVLLSKTATRADAISMFGSAKLKYEETKALCVPTFTKSKYDMSGRKIMMDIALANIESGKVRADVIVKSDSEYANTLSVLEGLTKKVESYLSVVQSMSSSDISDIRKAKLLANVKRMQMESLAKQLFFINKQNLSFVGGKKAQIDKIEALYVKIKGISDEILPTAANAKSLLEDAYYPLLNMFGVNSVYMKVAKESAADEIIALNKKYIKGREFAVTYDTVDTLANAAIIKKDKTLKAEVVKYLDKIISNPLETKPSLAKAYAWRARLAAWFYDEKTSSDPSVLVASISDYKEALKAQSLVNTPAEREKMFENGPSTLALNEEKALVDFVYANAANKGLADSAARVAKYDLVVDSIKSSLLQPTSITDVTGLSEEVIEKVGKEDVAAKMKARMTLAAIVMSLSEPLTGNVITLADAKRICAKITGQLEIKGEADLFTLSSQLYGAVNNKVDDIISKGEMTDSDLISLGVDPVSVSAKMVESYMIVAMKDSSRVKEVMDMVITALAKATNSQDPIGEGKLLMTKANLTFWKAKDPVSALKLYEDGMLKASRKSSLSELVSSNYNGVGLKDLYNYAEAKLVAAYRLKSSTALSDASTTLGVVATRDAGKDYTALVYKSKGELINATTDEKSGDKAAHKKSFSDAIGYLCDSLDILSKKKNGKDINAQIAVISAGLYKNKDAMRILGSLIEAQVRLYNVKVMSGELKGAEAVKEWNKVYAEIQSARLVTQKYLNFESKWETTDDIESIGRIIAKSIDDEYFASDLRRVPSWRYKHVMAGRGTEYKVNAPESFKAKVDPFDDPGEAGKQ